MAIIYKNNMKTHRYNSYSNDLNRGKMECRISRRSILFISLSLCVISLFYISLLNIYEENIVQYRKNIEIMSRNLTEIENESNNNMQRKNTMNHSDKTNESSKNSYNNETVTLENKPYNDLSKNLTEKELFDVLKSLEECPSKEDLINIWAHTLGVANEDFENINKSLKGFMEKYLDNDVYKNSVNSSVRKYIYKWIWGRIIWTFYRTVATEEVEYTKNFYSLIKGDHTLDDILKFIYSFLEYFQILKKELHEKNQTELLHKMAILLNENH